MMNVGPTVHLQVRAEKESLEYVLYNTQHTFVIAIFVETVNHWVLTMEFLIKTVASSEGIVMILPNISDEN